MKQRVESMVKVHSEGAFEGFAFGSGDALPTGGYCTGAVFVRVGTGSFVNVGTLAVPSWKAVTHA